MAFPIFPLVDRLLDGNLAEELRSRRANGDSFQTIARWLAKDHDIEVNAETIRLWVRDLEAQEGAA